MKRTYDSMSSSVEISSYRDQHFKGSRSEQEKLLRASSTLYIGNLSFYTTEEQIYELFSRCGDIRRVVMGLDKYKKTPCGFCFVEYYTRLDSENCMRYINGTRLDDRIIRCDWDAGFIEGRQYGRGKTGGQGKFSKDTRLLGGYVGFLPTKTSAITVLNTESERPQNRLHIAHLRVLSRLVPLVAGGTYFSSTLPLAGGYGSSMPSWPLCFFEPYENEVRDEYRTDYDGGRGGYGKIIAQKITPNTLER